MADAADIFGLKTTAAKALGPSNGSGTAALAEAPRDMPKLGPLPGTPHLNAQVAPTVPQGAPRPFGPGEYLANPDGSWSNEISVTVSDPALNGGRPTVVPSLWLVDGQPVRVDEDTAARYAVQSGLQFPSYGSEDEAERASEARENNWQNIEPQNAGSVPSLYQAAPGPQSGAAPPGSNQTDATAQALRMWENPQSGTAALAPPPTLAEGWGYNAKAYTDWVAAERQRAIDEGLLDPRTGWPTEKGARQMAETALWGFIGSSEAPGGIRAFHASPHAFNRFDLSKIGSGEGAQVQGHGLYFAQREGTSRWYWDKFKRNVPKPTGFEPDFMYDGEGYHRDILQDDWRRPLDRWMAINAVLRHKFDPALARQEFVDVLNRPNLHPDAREEYRAALDWLDANHHRITPPPPRTGAHMYEVNIRADPENMLDWDKPLHQQSPQVQAALRGDNIARVRQTDQGYVVDYTLNGETKTSRPFPSEQAARDAVGPVTASLREWVAAHQKAEGGRYNITPDAARALRAAGIPGVRYLDQRSRPVEVHPISYDNGRQTWGVYPRLSDDIPAVEFPTQAEAEAHADQLRSHNYVVFDDSLIDIIRRYGFLGLLPGGLGAAGLSPRRDNQAQMILRDQGTAPPGTP
jgi:hypothetical protein